MNPTSRTLIFVAVAAVSALVAASAWYASKPGDIEGYAELGLEFFPKFDDPLKATALSVTDFDKKTKEVQQFAVKQNDNGLWVIPSHHDYPAEADERLARTAASLTGVRKVAVQSRSKDDWKSYGVVAPDTKGTSRPEERGTEITLRDGSGNALVDLIVGHKVADREGFYYVREPEKATTYIAKLDVDLSAKFSDWIEPDLLKVNQTDIVEIIVDKYSIDEQRGVIVPGETLKFVKEDLKSSGKWTLEGVADDEQLDVTPVSDIARNLDQLKIVGVRPKPEGLSDDFSVNPLVRQMLEAEMQRQGFFIAQDREGKEKLYSNEGELIAGVGDGVQYTLYFGEIARGSSKDIETGLNSGESEKPGEEADSKPADETSTDDEAGPRRYLLIKAGFNEELLGKKPQPPVKPESPAILSEPAKQVDSGNDPNPKPDSGAEKTETGDDAANSKDAGEPNADKQGVEKTGTNDADSQSSADEDAAEENACDPFSDQQDEAAVETAVDPPADTAIKSAQDSPASDEPDREPEAPEESESDALTKPAAPTAPDASKDTADPGAASADEPVTREDAATPSTNPTEAIHEPAAVPEKDPKQAAQESFDKAMAEYQAANTAYERDLKQYNKKSEDGQKKVNELSRRFAGWYYVITADSFEKFRISRKDVVSKKAAEQPKDGASPQK